MSEQVSAGIFTDKIKSFFTQSPVLALFILIAVLATCFLLGFLFGRVIEKLHTSKQIKKERAEALKKSKAVLRGQIYEELAPFFPNFPVNPKSLKFLGKPIDYIAFVGSAENPEMIEEIVFIEIKTGTSNLTQSEKSIKKAIAEKRVRFLEYNI